MLKCIKQCREAGALDADEDDRLKELEERQESWFKKKTEYVKVFAAA